MLRSEWKFCCKYGIGKWKIHTAIIYISLFPRFSLSFCVCVRRNSESKKKQPYSQQYKLSWLFIYNSILLNAINLIKFLLYGCGGWHSFPRTTFCYSSVYIYNVLFSFVCAHACIRNAVCVLLLVCQLLDADYGRIFIALSSFHTFKQFLHSHTQIYIDSYFSCRLINDERTFRCLQAIFRVSQFTIVVCRCM